MNFWESMNNIVLSDHDENNPFNLVELDECIYIVSYASLLH